MPFLHIFPRRLALAAGENGGGGDVFHKEALVRIRNPVAVERRLGGTHRAAGLVAEDHQNVNAEPHDGEFQRREHRGVHGVTGGADHEDVAKPLVEQQLDGDARIAAGKHAGERLLARLQLLSPGRVAMRSFNRTVHESFISFDELQPCFIGCHTPIVTVGCMEFDPSPLNSWYRENGRSLPWREPGTSPWAVLVSEVMSQQTPVNRVIPAWKMWMQRWPTPKDLALADTADVLRAWGRLGYPRRALRLQEAARKLAGSPFPREVDELLTLPGIGDYTARAVASFAFGQSVPVVDVNVRRVHYRLFDALFLTPPAKKSDLNRIPAPSPELSVALMELGALICTATNPTCDECPLKPQCAWIGAGKPMPTAEEMHQKKKRVQKFEGTDRQVRGKIMALLRDADEPLASIDHAWPDAAQRSRALYSLLEDGLAEQLPDGRFSLPR